jgi:hypothetical protein
MLNTINENSLRQKTSSAKRTHSWWYSIIIWWMAVDGLLWVDYFYLNNKTQQTFQNFRFLYVSGRKIHFYINVEPLCLMSIGSSLLLIVSKSNFYFTLSLMTHFNPNIWFFSVSPTDLLLRLGEYDVSNEKEPHPYIERRVQIIAPHPQFDPRTFEYDLALLRFYEPIHFQRNIIPICISEANETYVGRWATVTGWGRLHEGI